MGESEAMARARRLKIADSTKENDLILQKKLKYHEPRVDSEIQSNS